MLCIFAVASQRILFHWKRLLTKAIHKLLGHCWNSVSIRVQYLNGAKLRLSDRMQFNVIPRTCAHCFSVTLLNLFRVGKVYYVK